MISRICCLVFVLGCLLTTSFTQSPQKQPQGSEDKQVKTPAAGSKKPGNKLVAPPAASGQIDEKMFGAMRWRQVGPFRGGRVLAVTGVPGEPNVFYFGDQKITTQVYMMTPPETESVVLDITEFMWEKPNA